MKCLNLCKIGFLEKSIELQQVMNLSGTILFNVYSCIAIWSQGVKAIYKIRVN